MSRRHHYKRQDKESPELDITTFLNLMVVLIPFLLITAVFSRITIMELNVPTGGGPAANNKPQVTIEVIIRKKAIEIGNGKGIVASIPLVNEKYDYAKLSEYLTKIKKNYPDKTDATVLMEPDLSYEHLVATMDAVRSAEIISSGEQTAAAGSAEEITRFELFPDISVGDAP